MKKIPIALAVVLSLTNNLAHGADMAPKAPMPAASQSWTGPYAGVNAGYGWGRDILAYSPNDPGAACFFGVEFDCLGAPPPPGSVNKSGFAGGFQFGYNWQFSSNWLAGLEADFDGSSIKGSNSSISATPFIAAAVTNSESVDWFGTVRARLANVTMDRLLAFVTGGFAYGRVARAGSYANTTGTTSGSAEPPFSNNCLAFSTCFSGSASSVNVGWAAGGGLEYAVSQTVTFKVEYLHVSLGKSPLTETATATVNAGLTPDSFSANYGAAFNVTRVGLNYRF